jgi:hypothetical protein
LEEENAEVEEKKNIFSKKLQDEELQNLRQKVEIWETIEKKWTKT